MPAPDDSTLPDTEAALADERRPPLQRVIDHLPAMVGYWDRDARNRMANRAYVEWFGVAPEEMAGVHISEVLGPEVYAKNLPYIEGALAGRAQRFTRELVDMHGRRRITQAEYVPDMDAGGAVRGFFVLVTDISDRVALEEVARRNADLYRALARDTPNGFVLLFDRDLRYIVAGGASLGELGYRPEDLEGRQVGEVVEPERAERLERHYRAALAGETVRWERREGGRKFAMCAGPVRDEDGVVFAGMVSATDVTEIRQGEALNEALSEIATSVARQAAPAVLFGQIADRVRELFDAPSAFLVQFGEGDLLHVLAAAPGLPRGVERDIHLGPDDERHSAVGAVRGTGRPAIAELSGPHGSLAWRLHEVGLGVSAAAPVGIGGRPWGALAVAAHDRADLPADVLRQLAAFADLAELAVANAEAWERLRRDATTDPLTGLANHRALQERLRHELAHAQRHDQPLSVVLLDIDHFKSINDTYGHGVGDAVLAELARRLVGHVRGRELIARIGGEEFAWILPATSADEALHAAERLREAIADVPFAHGERVTTSAGVCDLAGAGDPSRLLELADRALYAAKAAGRNRTCVHAATPGAA
jgi:diguanylate cyclase (GGDEF)-like protein/PAS domain S-box-containing protein